MSNQGGGVDVSKEEREALLTKKMEEIRRKNERLRKRHEMIQADRVAAEQSGQAVNVKLSAITEPSAPPHKTQAWGVQDGEGQEGQDRRSKFAVGRGKRLANRNREAQARNDSGPPPGVERTERAGKPDQPAWQGGGGNRPARNNTQEPKSPTDKDGPPPDPTYSFLADRSREGPISDGRGGDGGRGGRRDFQERGGGGGEYRGRGGGGGPGGRRHPRNFGGQDFNNVKDRMQHEKYSRISNEPDAGRRGGGGGFKSEMDMQLEMTGRERREYTEWKREREQIDTRRMERQRTAEGDWRREWDKQKDEDIFEEPSGGGGGGPPRSRHVEPARRPAGRIGSGRFDRGTDEEQAPPQQQRSPTGTGETLTLGGAAAAACPRFLIA